jgi:hypothetical protein
MLSPRTGLPVQCTVGVVAPCNLRIVNMSMSLYQRLMRPQASILVMSFHGPFIHSININENVGADRAHGASVFPPPSSTSNSQKLSLIANTLTTGRE